MRVIIILPRSGGLSFAHYVSADLVSQTQNETNRRHIKVILIHGELSKNLRAMVDQKMCYIIDSLYPIPDILNKNERVAIDQLKEAGLIPVFDVQYPENTPLNGIVRSYSRNAESFKKINVRIIHGVPDVKGLKENEALAELQKAGFKAVVTHQAVAGKENGFVLQCNRYDETKLDVSLLVSSSVPEIIGISVEEARRLLQSEGYEITVLKEVSRETPGTVINWVSGGDKMIKLHVSIPEKYEAKHVAVNWTNMQDSSYGDYYSAAAEFDNKSNMLTINLSYTIGTKTKHQITGIHTTIPGTTKIPFLLMVPNTSNSLNICFSSNDLIKKLPDKLTFYLDTEYGLLKKSDTITLEFVIDWPGTDF